MKALITCCVVAILISIAAADEPKPNVAEVMAKDARLDAKVTLSLAPATLSDAVATLATAADVKLFVRDSIRDDEVILYCKDRTVREVMKALADVWSYEWRLVKTKEGEPIRYSLAMPDGTRLKRERVLNQLSSRLNAKLKEQLQTRTSIGDFSKLQKLADVMAERKPSLTSKDFDNYDDYRAYRKEYAEETKRAYKETFGADPSTPAAQKSLTSFATLLAFSPQATLGQWAIYSLLATLPPDSMDALFAGQAVEYVVPPRRGMASPPAAMRDAITARYGKRPEEYVMTDAEITETVKGVLQTLSSGDPRERPYYRTEALEQYGSANPDAETVRRKLVEKNERAKRINALPAQPVRIRFDVRWDSPCEKYLRMTIWQTATPIPRVESSAQGIEKDPPKEADPEFVGHLEPLLAYKRLKFDPPKAVEEHYPGENPQGTKWCELLSTLHDKTGVDIVAQFFHQQSLAHTPAASVEITVEDYLRQSAKEEPRQILYSNRFLLYRDPLTYMRRPAEPPAHLVRKWQESEDRAGCTSLADLLEVGALPKWQFDTLIGLKRDNGGLHSLEDLYMGRKLLPFLASLQPATRKAYLAGERVWIDQLSASEAAAFWDAFVVDGSLDPPESQARVFTEFHTGVTYRVWLHDPATDRRWCESLSAEKAYPDKESLYEAANAEFGYVNVDADGRTKSNGYVIEKTEVEPQQTSYYVTIGWVNEDASGSSTWDVGLKRVWKDEK